MAARQETGLWPRLRGGLQLWWLAELGGVFWERSSDLKRQHLAR
jgi:hypothetical protein